MATDLVLPTARDVAELFEALLGRSVTTGKADRSGIGPGDRGAVAIYSGDDGTAAIYQCDLPLAVLTGAALSMIPPTQAQERARDGELDGAVLENLGEVMNISAQFFNRSGGRHVKLTSVHLTPTDLPDEISAILTGPGSRLDLEIDIEDYGKGGLSLLVR